MLCDSHKISEKYNFIFDSCVVPLYTERNRTLFGTMKHTFYTKEVDKMAKIYITDNLTDIQAGFGALCGIALCFGVSDFADNRISRYCMSHGE